MAEGKPRMAQQARRKKKSLKQIQDEMFDKNFEARFDKAVRKTKEDISKVDKGFMKDPKNRDKIIMDTFVKADRTPVKEMRAASNREGASVYNKMAKGGRAGFKMGSGKCKLAKRGKGRAYGKNS
jgi:hypothetical protein